MKITNQNSYGKGMRINKRALQFTLLVFCLVTPFTSWLLCFTNKIKSQWIRWD